MDGILKEDALNVTLVTMKFQDGFADNIPIKSWTIAEYYDKIRYWQDKYTSSHGVMVDFKLKGGYMAQ